jgi:hypothetical protein
MAKGRWSVLIMAGTLLAYGCSGAGVGPSPPLPEASESPRQSALAHVASPIDAAPFEREIWLELFPGQPDAVTYASLKDLTTSSDVVVVGAASTITKGPDIKDSSGTITYWAVVTFSVEEILAGSLSTKTPDTVAVWMLLGVGGNGASTDYGDRFAQARLSIPSGRTALFLLNLGEWARAYGRPTDAADADPMGYMLNGGQSWYSDVSGRVEMSSEPQGTWPLALDGTPFDALLRAVRDYAT